MKTIPLPIHTIYHSPLGDIRLTFDKGCIIEARFNDTPLAADLNMPVQQAAGTAVIEEAVRWLDAYFSGRDPGTTPPLRPAGTDFQLKVWRVLQQTPYGSTTTYKRMAIEVARALQVSRMAPQAIGQAAGSNPLLIFIPCHRIVSVSGCLTGYAGGLWRKKALLELEGVQTGVSST